MRSTNSDKPFERGEVIVFCEEEYVVMENYGLSGKVHVYGFEQNIIGNFYWDFYGEACVRKETEL